MAYSSEINFYNANQRRYIVVTRIIETTKNHRCRSLALTTISKSRDIPELFTKSAEQSYRLEKIAPDLSIYHDLNYEFFEFELKTRIRHLSPSRKRYKSNILRGSTQKKIQSKVEKVKVK